jgi:hypothetical protein
MLVSICEFPSKFRKISDLSLSIFLTFPPINLLEGFDMTQLSKLTSKIILALLSSAYLMSCTGGNVSSSFGMSSTGSAIDNIPPGMSSGVVDPSFFFVGVDSEVNDIAHVHQEGLFGTACSIDPNSSLQDIRCIVDAPEAEIFMHGLALKYNVPPGMCRYLGEQPYWFWNHEIGWGPSSIEINLTVTDGAVTGSSCRFNGTGGFGACNSNVEALIDVSTSAPIIRCIYDHTDIEGGQNGCLGSYTLTVNTTTIVTTPFSSTLSNSVTKQSWGGTYGPLVGGAARWGWEIGSNGLPVKLYTQSHLGLLNKSYTVPAPINSIAAPTTMEIANYYTPALNSHDGYLTADPSTKPYALEPLDDFSGDYVRGGNDAYLYECVDQAHEILHRIRVYVREWDTYQDYYDYITTKGVTEVPDRRVGDEGSACTGLEGACNDYFDLDDMAVGWVSYTTNVPMAPFATDLNIPRRKNYFPQIPKK